MTGPSSWISYGLPTFGVAFGLAGLAAAWISARRFDARFGEAAPATPVERAPRLSPYRRSMQRGPHGKPRSAAVR